ncbi:MAG: hypothetical protein Fur0040_10420 [Sideroxydans sp.]
MSPDDRPQQNARYSTALHALRQVCARGDAESTDDACKARAMSGLLRDGWLVLPVVALVFARILGAL